MLCFRRGVYYRGVCATKALYLLEGLDALFEEGYGLVRSAIGRQPHAVVPRAHHPLRGCPREKLLVQLMHLLAQQPH
eukprot:9279941-Pyramimonas_sp.AAC.2